MSKSSLSLFTVHKWKFTMNAAGFETDKNKRGELSKYTQRWCKGNARRHQLFFPELQSKQRQYRYKLYVLYVMFNSINMDQEITFHVSCTVTHI